MISHQERIDRILNTSRIIYLEQMTVHEVFSVERVGELIFVNTGTGLLFQDLDVMTLEEACEAERAINFIKNKYKIENKAKSKINFQANRQK